MFRTAKITSSITNLRSGVNMIGRGTEGMYSGDLFNYQKN